jgi:hypothetical protein
MTFDASEAVRDKIVHLDDEIKDLKARRNAATNDLDTQISAKQDELDGWQRLLGGPSQAPTPAQAQIRAFAAPSEAPADEAQDEPAPEDKPAEDKPAAKPAAKKAAAKK